MTDLYGWRSAYQLFALMVLLVSLPLALLVLREAPADDGAGQEENRAAEFEMSAGAAARSANYWLILTSFFLVGIGITSILSHLVPMLTDRGMSYQSAARAMSVLAFALIFGRMLAGYLMDHFFAPYITAVFIVFGLAGGIVLLALGAVGPQAYVAAALVGLATGSEISEIAYIVGRYFGRGAFGLIYGIMFGAFQLGSAISAPLMGYYFDQHGDYIGALWGVVVLVLLGAVLIAKLSPYPD
jgi:predicted MFS family arabinose efflux permease